MIRSNIYCLFAFCDREFLGGNLYILEYLKISFSVAVSR